MNFNDPPLLFLVKINYIPIIIYCSLLPVVLNMANNLHKEYETHVFIQAVSQTSFGTLKHLLIIIGSSDNTPNSWIIKWDKFILSCLRTKLYMCRKIRIQEFVFSRVFILEKSQTKQTTTINKKETQEEKTRVDAK